MSCKTRLKVIPFYIGDFRTHIFVLILTIIKGIERLTQRRHIQRSTSRLNSLLLYQKFTVDFKHAYLPGQLQVLCPTVRNLSHFHPIYLNILHKAFQNGLATALSLQDSTCLYVYFCMFSTAQCPIRMILVRELPSGVGQKV